ncbi:hypothetical protein HF086_000873 [Spodoptera exigua]|uniref:Gag-like protein n=1 Tax=Spodoptera exigua TaxID=7107 RepID=A0A922SDE5_SPOEX|nr:hypothetical protein HF086_000873 [Spodoptera exigua]
MRAAASADKLEEDERQIAALTKRVTEGRVTRLSESSSVVLDLGVEAEELPASDLNQRLADAVAAIRRVSKVSKGLSGCSKKALKEATASIMESAQLLMTRTTAEETTLLRAQNKKLASQMAELRKEHEELKEEMANFRREQLRREVGLPPTTTPQQPQLPSQDAELTRLIRQEMASFNARFSVLEGRILRPPLAGDQANSQVPTYAAQAAAPRASKSAPAAGAAQKAPHAAQPSQAGSAGHKKTTPTAASQRKAKKEAKLAKNAGSTSRPATSESATRPEAEFFVDGKPSKDLFTRNLGKKKISLEFSA